MAERRVVERQFAVSGRWALGSDRQQWILYQHWNSITTPWTPVSFVRSTKDILARCMREKGCPEEDMAALLKGLPSTYDEWLEASQPHPLEASYNAS